MAMMRYHRLYAYVYFLCEYVNCAIGKINYYYYYYYYCIANNALCTEALKGH